MKKVLIVTGPSGIGKTYLADQLLKKYSSQFEQVKLFTTRAPRKNEALTDRIFVNEPEFLKKQEQEDFVIADKFHGNWYGYSKNSLSPGNKHKVVNAWPALIKQFYDMPNICIIGLAIDKSNFGLLEKRMLQRGDTTRKVNERLKIIENDMQDLIALKEQVKRKGKLFTVMDDNDIHNFVIPWIIDNLKSS